jgi:serine/threonine protein kinase
MVPHAEGSSQVLWEDGERVVRRGWRLDDNGKRRAVLTVLPAADTRASLDRLAHEYQLRDELDTAWALRPLELVSHAGRTMLVLEDSGGEPLDRQLGAPIAVGRFLSLAIAIVEGLGRVHQRGLIHKDIKPANILINPLTDEARLTGFGIASRLPRERQSPDPPDTIAGTLAYMAPEQTRGFDATSAPPARAAIVISRMSLVKILPRLASCAPLRNLMLAHLLWPAMYQHSQHTYRGSHADAPKRPRRELPPVISDCLRASGTQASLMIAGFRVLLLKARVGRASTG